MSPSRLCSRCSIACERVDRHSSVPRRPQLVDLGRGVPAKALQHEVRVGTEQRRRIAQATRSHREADRDALVQERPRTWVLQQLVEPAGTKLRVVLDEITAVLHRSGWHTGSLEALGHVAGRSRRGPRRDRGIDLGGVLGSTGGVAESTVVAEVLTSDHRAQGDPRRVVRHRHRDPAVRTQAAVDALWAHSGAHRPATSAASRTPSAPGARDRSAPPSPPARTGRPPTRARCAAARPRRPGSPTRRGGRRRCRRGHARRAPSAARRARARSRPDRAETASAYET